MSEPYLTARQLAEVLGVSDWTVREWTRQGRLPAYRPGGDAGGWRYLESEVRTTVAQTRQAPEPPAKRRPRRHIAVVPAANRPNVTNIREAWRLRQKAQP